MQIVLIEAEWIMDDYITTISGVHFTIMDPKPEDIRIEDIAHALSLMTRANGHLPQFYSVAQHCIACYYEAQTRNYDQRVVLACLLHDASEAYLSDLTRPVKKNMTIYQQVEKQIQDMIYIKYLGAGLSKHEAELVSSVDDAELYYEFLNLKKEELMKQPPILVRSHDYPVRDMKEVEDEFLSCFEAAGGIRS